ncbi:hypothetical protein GCM10007386_50790 [Pseudoduganella dura]|nr:hypothetical protein GCM10007386_50790 [Pseudoduganella dura]
MRTNDRGAYAAFVRERDAGIATGRPLQQSVTGDFSRFSNGYWIARDEAWRNDAGEPYTLYCHDTPPSGMLLCSTTYRLILGPQVTYGFRANQDELASVAKTVDLNLHVLLDSITSKQHRE